MILWRNEWETHTWATERTKWIIISHSNKWINGKINPTGARWTNKRSAEEKRNVEIQYILHFISIDFDQINSNSWSAVDSHTHSFVVFCLFSVIFRRSTQPAAFSIYCGIRKISHIVRRCAVRTHSWMDKNQSHFVFLSRLDSLSLSRAHQFRLLHTQKVYFVKNFELRHCDSMSFVSRSTVCVWHLKSDY